MADSAKIDWYRRLLPALAVVSDPDQQQQALHRVKIGMIAAVALSYILDALVLAAFFAAGAVKGWIPLLFLACGLTECAVAYHYVRGPAYRAWTDRYMTLPRMIVSCLIQIVFILLAPAIALYFIIMLFIVFGFGCLRMKAREAAILWLLVTAALSVIVVAGVDVLQLPHATQAERAIGLAAGMLALGRTMLIGLFSSALRNELGIRYKVARTSLADSEADRTRTSIALHEDLSQDLAGIAMTLSAYPRDCGDAIPPRPWIWTRPPRSCVAQWKKPACSRFRPSSNAPRVPSATPTARRRARLPSRRSRCALLRSLHARRGPGLRSACRSRRERHRGRLNSARRPSTGPRRARPARSDSQPGSPAAPR